MFDNVWHREYIQYNKLSPPKIEIIIQKTNAELQIVVDNDVRSNATTCCWFRDMYLTDGKTYMNREIDSVTI